MSFKANSLFLTFPGEAALRNAITRILAKSFRFTVQNTLNLQAKEIKHIQHLKKHNTAKKRAKLTSYYIWAEKANRSCLIQVEHQRANTIIGHFFSTVTSYCWRSIWSQFKQAQQNLGGPRAQSGSILPSPPKKHAVPIPNPYDFLLQNIKDDTFEEHCWGPTKWTQKYFQKILICVP